MGTGTATTDNSLQKQGPEDLDNIIVALAPLVFSALVIKLTLDFLFIWAENAVANPVAGSVLSSALASRLTGLPRVDMGQAPQERQRLYKALLERRTHPGVVEPDSVDPTKWPLEKLEIRLAELQEYFFQIEDLIEEVMISRAYISRKALFRSILGLVIGVEMALVFNVHLFESIGFKQPTWFSEPFKIIDLILAGLMMGLGADLVLQLIGVSPKEKPVPEPRPKRQSVDPEVIKELVSQAVQEELEMQIKRLREEVSNEMNGLTPPGEAVPEEIE